MPYKKPQNHPPSKEQFHGIIEKLPQSIRRGFAKTTAKDLNAWLRENLPSTLASRRNKAYREYRSKTPDHNQTPV